MLALRPAPSTPRTLRAASAQTLAIDAATVEAVRALDDAGVRTLLLKGPALAGMLYEGDEGRLWVDADLLTHPDRHQAALAALATIGFEPRISNPVERGSVPYAVHLVRAGSPAPGAMHDSIDLHRGFAGVGATFESFWSSVAEDADSIELFGHSISVPSIPARLAVVALHAAAHGRDHAKSMRDVERAVERFDDACWAEAMRLAETWRALDFFVIGVRLAPGGSDLVARLGVAHEPSRAASMRGAGMPRAQRGLEQLGRTAGLASRLRLIARKLFPTPQLMRIWAPLARRGPLGLAVAYMWRPLWLLGQVPPVIAAFLRAGPR
jgi:hypothetical protein